MSTQKQLPEFYVIRETILESWLTDASTTALAFALILPGWFLGSSAMQWAGVISLFMTMFARAGKRFKRMTIAEARAELDRIEKESA